MGQQARSIFNLSFPAAPAAVLYGRGVDFTGTQITVAGAKIAGIANQGALLGGSFDATAIGTAVCEAGAAIAVGQPLAMDATGRVVPATALAIAAGAVAVTSVAANGAADLIGSVTAESCVGRALEAASGAGVYIEVLLSH